MTHCPPRSHLDVDGFGDDFLLEEVLRVKPTLHVFGHVHEGYGSEMIAFDEIERLYERVPRRESGIMGVVKLGMLVL